MKVIKLLCGFLALALVGAGAWYGRFVPFTEQWPLFEALRTTAAIIFAVVGAWLAIIYPDRLRLSFNVSPKESAKDSDASTSLFTPVVNSTYVLCIILAIGVVVPLLRTHVGIVPIELWTGVSTTNVEIGRGVSYGLLVLLTLWQLWTVFCTLDPADRIKSYMDQEAMHQKNVNAVTGRRQ